MSMCAPSSRRSPCASSAAGAPNIPGPVSARAASLPAWIAGEVGIGFTVTGFWTALGGALVITLVERLVNSVFSDDD